MRTGVSKDKAKDKNVTYARLKRAGMRFELSLYRDKIPNKADITTPNFAYKWVEMLVAPIVFSNAAKSEPAEKKDITTAFPEMSEQDIWKMIFEKGEVVQTQEDRVDHVAEDKSNVAKIAATIAAHSHVLPVSALNTFHETKSDKELSKLRLERYSTADIERELKNIRFKPLATSVCSQDTVTDAIAAIRTAGNIPILRDQHVCIIRTVKDSGTSIASVIKAFGETVQPIHGKIIRQTADDVVALVDIPDAVKTLQLNEVLRGCQVHVSEEFYIPKDAGFADDLTPSTSGTLAEAQPKGGKGGAAAPPAKSSGGKGKPAASAGGVASTNLEAELEALKAGDSDDDGKGGKKAKGGKKGSSKTQPQQQQQPAPKKGGGKQHHKGDDSDDDEVPRVMQKKGGGDDSDDDEPVNTMKPKKKK